MRVFAYELGRKYRAIYSMQYRDGIVDLLRVCNHKSEYGKEQGDSADDHTQVQCHLPTGSLPVPAGYLAPSWHSELSLLVRQNLETAHL